MGEGGEGEGKYWSMLQLHWLPSPTLPKELEQCWQICLHVFIIIKNVMDPSSLEVQQIPLITFLSLLPLQSFCILSFILSKYIPLPGLFDWWGWTLPFPFLSLVAPWGFLMMVGSFKALLGGSS